VRPCACGGVGMGALAREWPHVTTLPRAGAILSASSLAPPYFSTLSHKRLGFRKKATEHEMCVLIFRTTFV
jgi:hypothetical protein